MTTRRLQDVASLLVVLVCALVTRFERLNTVEFFHDEAMVSMMAQEAADGLTFPLQGILSSVGIPNPPTSIYAMIPPFVVSSDPLIATGYVAGLNVLAAGMLWVIARREFGSAVALIAALAFVFNPWAILYSRKIWAQDYVMPFLLIALWLGLRGFGDGKRWAQALMLPAMLFAMQIHIAAWALVPLFIWVVWRGRRNIRPVPLLISGLLGVAVLTPYLLGLAQTLSADPSRISDALGRSGGAREPGLHAVALATELALGLNTQSWLLPNVPEDSLGIPSAATAGVAGLAGGLLLLGVFTLFRRRRGWLVGFGLWIALPVAAFQIGLADVWPHYFVPQLPAFALLSGVGLASLIPRPDHRPAVWRWLVVLVGLTAFFAMITLQTWTWSHLLSRASSEMVSLGEGTSGYTTPMQVLHRVREALSGQSDVVIIADGMDVWFDVEAARWPVILRDSAACVRTLPSDGFAVYPAGAFALVTTPSGADSPVLSRYPSTPVQIIPARSGEGNYAVTAIESISPALAFTAWGPQFYSNGVALTGYQLEAQRVTLRWSLPDAPSSLFYDALNDDYQVFVHLLGVDGNRLAQVDSRFWPGRHWCTGDTLEQWLTIDVSEEAAVLRVGFYRLNPVRSETATLPVDALDAMGNPAGHWADIPLP